MNRRRFALVSLSSSLTAMIGCNSEPKPDPLATLLNSSEVHEAFKTLQDAVSSLESKMDDFDDDNLEDVVEEAKTEASGVSDAVAALKNALGYSE